MEFLNKYSQRNAYSPLFHLQWHGQIHSRDSRFHGNPRVHIAHSNPIVWNHSTGGHWPQKKAAIHLGNLQSSFFCSARDFSHRALRVLRSFQATYVLARMRVPKFVWICSILLLTTHSVGKKYNHPWLLPRRKEFGNTLARYFCRQKSVQV